MATTMTSPPKPKPKTKITVSLTDEAAEAVETMAEEAGISVSEAIRRAISMQRFFNTELKQGSTVLLRDKNGDTERITFVFG